MSSENCFICDKNKSKYVCPRCNIPYCSVACYKAKEHLDCSEEFYKKCVLEEMKISANVNAKANQRKMHDILKRINDLDAGLVKDDLNEDLDSDDDVIEDDSNELDLIERLHGVDINNAEQVWERLTQEERKEFEMLIETGDIMKLLPEYQPWWLKNKSEQKIVELPVKDNAEKKMNEQHIPKLYDKIPSYETLCKKSPSPCLQYNLYNIMKSYASTIRYFLGEHRTNANEATAYFINLCVTLKYGTNFDSIEDAIKSVDIEAKTTGKGALKLMGVNEENGSLIESQDILANDVKQLMSSTRYKLAALSDLLALFNLAKQQLKSGKNKEAGDLQKLFALCCGMEEITYDKLSKLVKKLEFYLSYVNRENELL